MDEPGWHARRRAREEALEYTTPRRGPDGKFRAVEQLLDQPQRPSLAPPDFLPLGASPATPPGHAAANKYNEARMLSPVERTNASVGQRLMNPHLQLVCGPLLRYDTIDKDGIYHGACLIVTADASSKYDPHPFMVLSWDPTTSGLCKTPSDHSTGRSRSESSAARMHYALSPHPSDPRSLFNSQPGVGAPQQPPGPTKHTLEIQAEELWVYSASTGMFTFWRFKYEFPIPPINSNTSMTSICVTYTINNSQPFTFYVPSSLQQNLRWAAHSCNGFSAGVNPDDFRGVGFDSGYDPVWTDLLLHHQEDPFHVLVGGGDQLYCDKMIREPELQDWVLTKDPQARINYQITQEDEEAIDRFLFTHYCNAFRQGAFARANSSIPMINMLDDHDLIDGFGSYPEDLQNSQMFKRIGSRGYFYFLLFQCFINDEKDGVDHIKSSRVPSIRSLILGGPGSYIPYPSHSFLTCLGPKVQLLMLDCRAERKKNQICSELEYSRVFGALKRLPDGVEHLVVQVGIPIAYPRMNFLEKMLESKFNPVTAISKTGTIAKNFVNKFNADAELLDDLNDHWTATPHKRERNWLVEQFQHFALGRRLRVTFLSGDVHCAAVGMFKTVSKQAIDPSKDHRCMYNIVSSAIVNTPPPNAVLSMVSILSKNKHRTMHGVQTDEVMVPLFAKSPSGQKGKYKYVAGARNYATVDWDPSTGELKFDIRVEKQKGNGETEGYTIRVPPPLWKAQPSVNAEIVNGSQDGRTDGVTNGSQVHMNDRLANGSHMNLDESNGSRMEYRMASEGVLTIDNVVAR